MSDERDALERGASARPMVLLVDDAPEYIRVLGDALGEDYRLKVANHGAKALELAASASDPPDLILLDLLMPYLQGEDELRLLRMNSATEHIPVIVVTAMQEAKQEEAKYRRLGVVEIVTKPFDLDKLVAVIKRTIG